MDGKNLDEKEAARMRDTVAALPWRPATKSQAKIETRFGIKETAAKKDRSTKGKTSFTKVEGERHLYKYEHCDKHGQWSTKYYAVFTDWQGIPRRFSIGENLDRAKNKLGELRRKNDAEFDFDAEKRKLEEEKSKAKKGLTLSEWAAHYFDVLAPSQEKRQSTVARERFTWDRLEGHFGSMPLSEIKLTAISGYRVKREKEVSFITWNRELAFVRYLLTFALEDGALEVAPRIRLKQESGRVRSRTLTAEEYGAILGHMGREQQRYYIALWESAMRLREPTRLTWSKVDLKAGLIRLDAEDVKENYPRRIPISWELRQVLGELIMAQKRVPNVGGCVFTRRNGKPIKNVREAWLLAVEKAVEKKEIPDDDVVPHDFRRSAITRWTSLGIPRDIVMACSGHKPSGVHDGYINFTDQQLIDAFAEKGLLSPPAQRRKQAAKAKAL